MSNYKNYCRPQLDFPKLMKQKVIYVFTRDSIGLGEDGPTHHNRTCYLL